MLHFLRTILHPERYHGQRRAQRAPFFEGWYFKVIDPTGQHRLAVIPGIFWSNNPHAFVQVLDGTQGLAYYHEYPVGAFHAAEDSFDIRVGDNRFRAHEIDLHIDRPDQRVAGTLYFEGNKPWPVTWRAPGIMGWYAWVPFMECYHGVVSLDHSVRGELDIDGQVVDFSGGRGYIEKDWGRSFPEAWIWFQSNHFGEPGISLTGSIAIIPWLRTAFPGFIIGFYYNDHLYRFATYTGAKIERLAVTDDTIDWVVGDKNYRLEMLVQQGGGRQFGLLKGPDMATMGKRVAETLSAAVAVQLTERRTGHVVFSGTGQHAGLEVHEVGSRLLGMVDAVR